MSEKSLRKHPPAVKLRGNANQPLHSVLGIGARADLFAHPTIYPTANLKTHLGRARPQKMKLGLIADIHEHVDFLKLALDRFRDEQVKQIVVIGDIFAMGERIEETCYLLAGANTVGVWGNHDYGLCVEPGHRAQQNYTANVLSYMASLQPKLEVGGCLFTHVEPWLNPENVADLWYYEGPPDTPGKLQRIFAAAPNRIMFAGHFHRWLMATPQGISNWQGDAPMQLVEPDCYFVVVGALCEGRYATFDTETSLLTPFNEAKQLTS